MLLGYARVSTADQNLDLQIDALRQAGCERIFEDRQSGSVAIRPGLADALSHPRADDTLVVWKLDRLGRTVVQLVELVNDLARKGIGFRSLTNGIDTGTPHGRFFFHVMAGLAEMERDLIRERTRAGLAAAKARGRNGGRPRRLSPEQAQTARELHKAGRSLAEIGRVLGVSTSTVFRAIGKAEGAGI